MDTNVRDGRVHERVNGSFRGNKILFGLHPCLCEPYKRLYGGRNSLCLTSSMILYFAMDHGKSSSEIRLDSSFTPVGTISVLSVVLAMVERMCSLLTETKQFGFFSVNFPPDQRRIKMRLMR